MTPAGVVAGPPGDAALVLDVVLLGALLAYAVTGWRQGLVAGVLSLGGFVGGAVLGLQVLPALAGGWSPGSARAVVLIVGVLALAWAGQAAGMLAGRRLRAVVTARLLHLLDAALGTVAAVVAASLVMWFAAAALRGAPLPTLARAIGGSEVVGTLDRAVPDEAHAVVDRLQDSVRVGDFPRVFAGLGAEVVLPVEAPDPQVVGPAAARAAPGVVRIEGLSEQCRRGQEGSGFVVAPGRVITNAHVVAGVESPTVSVTGQGPALPATVVVFDPARDLAVLAVPELEAEPLPLGAPIGRGESAVVVGFPGGGVFEARPARVRQVVQASGEDIYGSPGVVREVYSLATRVQPGSSGGPVLDAAGDVVGVVFARSLDDPGTGYAVTLDEAAPVLEQVGASRPVSSGTCAG